MLCIGISFFGFMIIPILGIGYTFTAMNCLPVSPAASCGIVHILNSVVTLILNQLIAIYLETYVWGSIGIMGLSILLGAILTLPIR